MEFYEEDLEFALQMIIYSRGNNGATLYEIYDDFCNRLNIKLESLFGYKSWEMYIRGLLSVSMPNICVKRIGKCIVYFLKVEIDTILDELEDDLSESMYFICRELQIDLDDLRKRTEKNSRSMTPTPSYSSLGTSSSNTNSMPHLSYTQSGNSELSTSTSSVTYYMNNEVELMDYTFIGDNFFMGVIEQLMQCKFKFYKAIPKLCLYGQTIQKAIKNVLNCVHQIKEKVIINLGSLDLFSGVELIDMQQDMLTLKKILNKEKIKIIVTTIPPLANRMHCSELEHKRKLFNTFLFNEFDVIDIEHCFLNEYDRIDFLSYRPSPSFDVNKKWTLVKWSKHSCKTILKMLKNEVPKISSRV